MRSLHVAALPFPTEQGTQALIHRMLCALGEAGHETHLLCYPDAAFTRSGPYQIHRVRASIRLPSFRSGPSAHKLLLDLALGTELGRLCARLKPDMVIAHHVEAALAALARRARPVWFVAHTSLHEELGGYFPAWTRRVWPRLGSALDRFLCQTADRTLAVSPALAALLTRASGRAVCPLVPPWPSVAPIDLGERAVARQELAIASDEEVVLYAGNLDGYQGLSELFAGVAQLSAARPRLSLLVATACSAEEVSSAAFAYPSLRLRRVELAGEVTRRRVYAACNVVAVPRRIRGGIPVKLLDALARGAAVVAAPRALAGFSGMAEACSVVDAPGDWADAIARALDEPDRMRALGQRARDYMQCQHTGARFVTSLVSPPEGAGCGLASLR